MSAQIAPTPIVHGPEAEKIYEKANREPSEESRNDAKKLASIFDQMMK